MKHSNSKRDYCTTAENHWTAINMEPGQCFEILKIWVPRHGVVNVYRSPGGGTETGLRHTPWHGRELHLSCFVVFFFVFLFLDYHVYNGCLLEKTRNECGIEKIRILDSYGSVIVITRDRGHLLVQNKYSIEPPTLTMDVSSCNL